MFGDDRRKLTDRLSTCCSCCKINWTNCLYWPFLPWFCVVAEIQQHAVLCFSLVKEETCEVICSTVGSDYMCEWVSISTGLLLSLHIQWGLYGPSPKVTDSWFLNSYNLKLRLDHAPSIASDKHSCSLLYWLLIWANIPRPIGNTDSQTLCMLSFFPMIPCNAAYHTVIPSLKHSSNNKLNPSV